MMTPQIWFGKIWFIIGPFLKANQDKKRSPNVIIKENKK